MTPLYISPSGDGPSIFDPFTLHHTTRNIQSANIADLTVASTQHASNVYILIYSMIFIQPKNKQSIHDDRTSNIITFTVASTSSALAMLLEKAILGDRFTVDSEPFMGNSLADGKCSFVRENYSTYHSHLLINDDPL